MERVPGRARSGKYIDRLYLANCIKWMQQRPYEAKEPYNVKDQRSTLISASPFQQVALLLPDPISHQFIGLRILRNPMTSRIGDDERLV